MGRMASARMRADRRAYLSLMVGIFLSIYLVTVMGLVIQGIFLAQMVETQHLTGVMNVMALDCDRYLDSDYRALPCMDRLGHVYVLGEVGESGEYLGYLDAEGQALCSRTAKRGRMPEKPGEIAMEEGMLAALDMEAVLGETIGLTIHPVDGAQEERTYTLVGLLYEQSGALDASRYAIGEQRVSKLPAAVVSPEEPAFATGRVVQHRVMTVQHLTQLPELVVWSRNHPNYHLQVLSIQGKPVATAAEVFTLSQDAYATLVMAMYLGFSLVVTCCVGISSAMEGQLAKRLEEIGTLRALGATRRQIRRMFGRESLLMALCAALPAMGAAWGTAVLLARLAPERMVVRLSPWLMAGIAAVSILCILLSALRPLVRASHQMPMNILRNSGMMRKARRIRSKKHFRVARLIASRQMLLHPGRQLGAMAMVALMAVMGAMFVTMGAMRIPDPGMAWTIHMNEESTWHSFYVQESRGMTEADVRQIRAMPGVERVDSSASMQVLLLMDKVPPYLTNQSFRDNTYLLSWEEKWEQILRDFRKAGLGDNIDLEWTKAAARKDWEKAQNEYAAFRAAEGLSGHAVATTLTVATLYPTTLASHVLEGALDMEKLNRGEQVLAYYPPVYETKQGKGYRIHMDDDLKDDPDTVRLTEEGPFHPGDTVQLARLCLEGTPPAEIRAGSQVQAQRRDATVEIGAVLSPEAVESIGSVSGPCLITTEAGWRALGLGGYMTQANIYTTDDITPEEEEALDNRINLIARRGSGAYVYNYLASKRDERAGKARMTLLMAGIAVLFLAVAVSLTVGGVSRRIHAESRMLGMLRAVGADERTLTACFARDVSTSVASGGALGLLIWSLMQTAEFFRAREAFPVSCMGLAAFALLCGVSCQVMLRLRIRQVMNKSIVETIKEL